MVASAFRTARGWEWEVLSEDGRVVARGLEGSSEAASWFGRLARRAALEQAEPGVPDISAPVYGGRWGR